MGETETMGANGPANGEASSRHVRHVPLSFDVDNADDSARRVVVEVCPAWGIDDSNIKLERCKDGITNTLLKVSNERPGMSPDKIEDDTLLLRAYGSGTQVLIDRERELENHALLMAHGLAPELLARFNNGMLYRYIRGTVTSVKDLRRPPVLLAIARRLAQWHATVPCLPARSPRRQQHPNGNIDADGSSRKANGAATGGSKLEGRRDSMDKVAAGKPAPNLWTVVQKWIWALPTGTVQQRERQAQLQKELLELINHLSQRPGLGKNGLVFAHCDLLSGNIIIEPEATSTTGTPTAMSVSFIDYEYATPSPAAFDISNHFAEWTGFECDYDLLPTKSERRLFVNQYIRHYFDMVPETPSGLDLEMEVERLYHEVEEYRGVPGFYWGIWALIQAQISDIDFDYATYAESRLDEYWAWKGEFDGSREKAAHELPLREQRWARQ